MTYDLRAWWNRLTWKWISGRAERAAEVISKWDPQDLSSEKALEESLYTHLSRALPGLSIRRQFRYDRITADLLIHDDVAVEIKLNLTTTREFQRLIGQLETYARWHTGLVVVLVGEVNPDFKDRIEQRLRADWEECYEGEEAQVIHIPGPRR